MKAKLPPPSRLNPKRLISIGFAFVFLLGCARIKAQDDSAISTSTVNGGSKISLPAPPAFAENGRAIAELVNGRRNSDSDSESDSPRLNSQQFRIDRIEVKNGADLLTIF